MTADAVHVWLVGTDLPAQRLAELESLLDEAERRRLARLHPAPARRRFITAHGAARLIVGRCLGAPPAEIRWRRGVHGKPELTGRWTGVHVNLSHSGELAALALCRRRPVGVDIQELANHLNPTRLATRYFDAEEAKLIAAGGPETQLDRFGQLWTRKEACVKAGGGRLAHGLQLKVASPEAWTLVTDPTGSLPGECRVHDLAAPAGFRAAVAAIGSRPYRISLVHGLPGAPVAESPSRRLSRPSATGRSW